MRVSFYTLGCKVNQYETQSIREQFLKDGYLPVEETEGADVCIINTCSVTNVADRKSRQYIRKMKKRNPDAVIVVTGCYAQTDPEAASALEEVDLVIGTNEKNNIVRYVDDFLSAGRVRKERAESHILPYEELSSYEDAGQITAMDSRTRAFIKIEEGCDRFCSYCIIPYARGPVRSRAPESVLREARALAEGGYREIVLTGINTALYGGGPGASKDGIVGLVRQVSDLPGDFRIRLSSLEPNVIEAGTAEQLLMLPRLCHHMHLSIQSGSDSVLKRMNRRYTVGEYEDIVSVLRRMDPDYAVTTDIIVGFPGETEEEFQETLRTVRRIGFSQIHIFKYSVRTGTAAAKMPDQVSPEIKNQRAAVLAEEARRCRDQFIHQNLQSVRPVLLERFDEQTGLFEGYTDHYIKVYVSPVEGDVPEIGRFTQVRLLDPFRDGVRGVPVSD